MVEHGTPYEFGDTSTDGGLDEDAPDGCEEGTDLVVVDGDAMSFRSYLKTRET